MVSFSPAQLGSAGLETLVGSATWSFWSEQETKTKRVTRLVVIINSDPKWSKEEILWDTHLYSYLLWYILMGNHIKYF